MSSINIIGHGYVGSSISNTCMRNNIPYNIYDVNQHQYHKSLLSLVENSENSEHNIPHFYFICVPTPSQSNGECDTCIVQECIAELNSLITNTTRSYIIIKSTCLPGTSEKLQSLYPIIPIVFCPEFLKEKTFKEDAYNAKFALIGYPKPSVYIFNNLYFVDLSNLFIDLYKHNPSIKVIFKPSTECELFKYTLNVHLAVKVWYFNKIFDVSNSLEIDYNSMQELFKLDSRIGDYGTIVPGDHGRGFSGACLPKECRGMNQFLLDLNLDNSVLKNIIQENDTWTNNS